MQVATVIDIKALREITDGDAEIEKELAGLYMQVGDKCLRELQNLMMSGSDEDWNRILHELKGASANIRAEKLVGLCSEESNKGNMAKRMHIYLRIKSAYEELKPFLTRMAQLQ